MKLQSVKLENIHNHKDLFILLNPDITVFCGKNGAGKSSILQAIGLGLFGYIPGYGKRLNDTTSHSQGNSFGVKLNFDDGLEIEREWKKSNSKFIATTNQEEFEVSSLLNGLELPVFNFAEFTGLTANKQKKWFIDTLPKYELDEDWRAKLQNTQLHYITSDYLKFEESEDEFESIQVAYKEISDLLSFARKELDMKSSTIQSISNELELLPSEKVSEIADKIKDIDNKLDKINELTLKKSRYDTILKEYEDAKNNIEEERKRVEAYKQLLQEFKDTETNLNQRFNDLQAKIDYIKIKYPLSLQFNSDICPILNSPCEKLNKVLDNMPSVSEELSKLESDIQIVKNQQFELAKDSVITENHIKAAEDNVARYEEILNSGKLERLENEDYSLIESKPELQIQKDTLLAQIEETAVAQSNIDSMNKLQKEMSQLEEDIETLKSLKTYFGFNGLQSKLLLQPFEDMSKILDKVLGEVFNNKVSSKFILTQENNSFSFGIMRNNEYIPYKQLSSGEKCLYIIALYITLYSTVDTDLKIVMIDDMLDHLDEENSNKLFDCISRYENIQWIFACVDSKFPKKCNINL